MTKRILEKFLFQKMVKLLFYIQTMNFCSSLKKKNKFTEKFHLMIISKILH